MEITVNNQPLKLTVATTVAELLSLTLRVPQTGIAVAVNQSVVAKSDWPALFLKQGDQVVLIKATQGG